MDQLLPQAIHRDIHFAGHPTIWWEHLRTRASVGVGVARLLEWDEAKSARNHASRGIPFSYAERLDWQTALSFVDDRKDYGESRMRTLGLIDGTLHMLVTTLRGDRLRVISLRRGNARERKRYAQEIGPSG